MSHITRVALLLTVVFVYFVQVNCNLIREEDAINRDAPNDEVFEENEVEETPVDVGVEREGDTDKKCVDIGQFCMNHSDCCTNACLGYMKRCVSGSG